LVCAIGKFFGPEQLSRQRRNFGSNFFFIPSLDRFLQAVPRFPDEAISIH
jgi:hypothetical protein